MRYLPLDRARLGAALATTLAAAIGCALAPAGAAAHHDHGWSWQADTEDQAAWSGAGAGWNGGSTTTTTTTAPTATWTPQDTREVDVRDLRVTRAAISPDGDGEGDEVFVSLRLRRDSAPVSVRVVDAAGTTVRTLGEQRSTRVYGRFGWDGTTDADVVVPDGAYRIVLAKAETATSREAAADPLSIDVLVDTVSPAIQARRPTLVQLRALARRAGALRDAKRRWAARWNRRHPHGGPRGHQRHRQQRWSTREQQWVRLFESRQLRLPVTFTTVEDGEVTITTAVAGRTTELATWRAAGRHTLDVVLPTYAAGRPVSITFGTSDDAENSHRHTIVALLPAMPAPRPVRTRHEHGRPASGSPAPVTGVPTSGGDPLPDWLDPIMLRATYAAGVPQSWARSRALANILYRESSYRPTAQNPTSTAYGLFQFLDQTWATVGCRKTSDAYRQSVCGLRYIQRRYHTPEAAWRFWQANHWY